MSDPGSVGRAGEDRAAAYLAALGYTIVTRRQRTKSGEIDLIAIDGDCLVFVEVKTTESSFDVGFRVTEGKVARWRSAAGEYVASSGWTGGEYRYDYIELRGDQLRHVQNAVSEPLVTFGDDES